MNRIIYVARKAKGLSVKQLAKVLQITEHEYTELEHSLTDVNAQQAMQLARLFDIEPEMFLYNDGRDSRLIKYAMDEVTKMVNDVQAEECPPKLAFKLLTLGNTTISLQVELSHAFYRQYELEKDNEALRQLNGSLKNQLSVTI